MPAPDGGCVAPYQTCSFEGEGCYLLCTPPQPFFVDLPSACVTNPGENLCACVLANGGSDPCQPNNGDNCDSNTINLPSGQIGCLCY